MKRIPDSHKYCKYLRAKSPYGTLEGGENPWRFPDEPELISWCILSQGSMGPDNGLVAPRYCQKGRRCYIAPGDGTTK